MGAIDRWEENVRHLEHDFSIKLDERLKVAVLIEMTPTAFIDPLMARLEQHSDYPTCKSIVTSYLEQRIDMGGPAPHGREPLGARLR